MRFALACLLLSSLVAVSCLTPQRDLHPEQAFREVYDDHATLIHWYAGSVAEVFAKANSQDLPIVAFWSKAPCELCSDYQGQLFQNAQAAQVMATVLPLFLNEEASPVAQYFAETYQLRVNPTLLFLDAQGSEILRVSEPLSPAEFQRALAAAYSAGQPLSRMTEKIMAGKLNEAEWAVLAFSDWQDQALGKDPQERLQLLNKLVAEIPSSLIAEKARLTAKLMILAAEMPTTADRERDEIRRFSQNYLTAMFLNPEALTAGRALFLQDPNIVIRFLQPSPGEARARLLKSWQRALSELVTASPSIEQANQFVRITLKLRSFDQGLPRIVERGVTDGASTTRR